MEDIFVDGCLKTVQQKHIFCRKRDGKKMYWRDKDEINQGTRCRFGCNEAVPPIKRRGFSNGQNRYSSNLIYNLKIDKCLCGPKYLCVAYLYLCCIWISLFCMNRTEKIAVFICNCWEFGAVPPSMPAVSCERANAVIAGWKRGTGLSWSLFLYRGIG